MIAARQGRARLRTAGRVLLLCASLVLSLSGARAQAPFELQGSSAGSALGAHLAVLQDASGALALDDVRSDEHARAFAPVATDLPNYGFSEEAIWLRLPVRNPGTAESAWLLELAYPHLDRIELYVPRADGGYDLRSAGDFYPFAQREIPYGNFLFALREPPRSTRIYYLRVRSSGSLNLPLRAWSYDRFIGHQAHELPGVWMFYGLLLVMAAYNLFIYLSARHQEYLFYVLYNLSLALLQFNLNGHSFAYLTSENVWLENKLAPLLIPITFLWAILFMRCFLRIPRTKT